MCDNDDGFGIWSSPGTLLRPRPRSPPGAGAGSNTAARRTGGCKIALTPLVTDAPIIALALALAAKLAQLRPLLSIVSIEGGAFVLYLAWDGFRPVLAMA